MSAERQEINKLGKQIADQSNIRELITQARLGLLQHYQAVKTGEAFAKYCTKYDFKSVSDQESDGYRLEETLAWPWERWKIENIRERWKREIKNHSIPSPNEHQSYYIRLGWRGGTNPNLDLCDSGYDYIVVMCNPWPIYFWGSETLTIRGKDLGRVFKKDEWQDKEELKKAIFEAVKNPRHEGIPPISSGVSIPSFTSDGEHSRTPSGLIRI